MEFRMFLKNHNIYVKKHKELYASQKKIWTVLTRTGNGLQTG